MTIARELLKLAMQGESTKAATGDLPDARTRSPPTTSSARSTEAAANEREPLLVLEPLLAFLDAHGLGDGEPEIAPIGDGHSNVDLRAAPRRRRASSCAARRAPPLPPSRPRHAARGARAARAARAGRAVPRVLAVCDDDDA